MFGIQFTEPSDLLDGFFKVDGLAERTILEGMGDDGCVSVIVNIELYALDTSFQVLEVSFDLGVAGQLISSEVSVVGGVAEIVSQGEIFRNVLVVDWVVADFAF